MDIKLVPLNDLHLSIGAKMVSFAGYNMPVRYTSDIEEHQCVRENVGVFDVSHMGEFFVSGPGSLDFLQLVTSNDVSKLTDWQIQYSCFPNDQGGIVDDLLVYKLGKDQYMLVVNASNIEKDWNWLKKHEGQFKVTLENASSDFCLFAIQGPNSASVLNNLTKIDVNSLDYYTFCTTELAEIQDVIISATGYTGAGGYEIYVKNENALHIWTRIFEEGKSYNIQPIGLGARDTLRLEMGYCLYGNDINDNTSPIAAGLGWITKFNKVFIHSKALLEEKNSGSAQKLVGFEMLERGIPRANYDIFDKENRLIGNVTSGTQSPTLSKGIGMGYVNKDYTALGQEIFINIRDKKIKAIITKTPFVKNNTKV